MNKGKKRWILWIAIMSLIPLTMIPPVSGDGTPIYYQQHSDSAEDPYSVTVEARQLASITLLNDTHQRIDLFLSVYSLDPDQNMTIMVPFRAIPEDVDSHKTKDTEFLDEIGFDKIKKISNEQSLDHAWDRMEERSMKSIRAGAAASDFGPFGLFALYLAENYQRKESNYDDGVEKSGSGSFGEFDTGVSEVKRYDFEGTSVTVYSVGVNATLDSFLNGIKIADPPSITADVLEEYKGHYALTIDCMTKPPIDEDSYRMLNDIVPQTLDDLNAFTRVNTLQQKEIADEARSFAQKGFKEIVDSDRDLDALFEQYQEEIPYYYQDDNYWIDDYYNYTYGWHRNNWHPFDLLEHFNDLLNVIYGYSEMNGTVISVITELDQGKIFFPLGTSKGWSRPISQTIVALDVPKEVELDLSLLSTYSAFIEDRRYYLFEYLDANPGEDIVGTIHPSDGKDERRAELATRLHNYIPIVGIIVGVSIQTGLFFLCLLSAATAIRIKYGSTIKVLSLRNALLMISTLILSGPMTYYLFVHDPRSEKGTARNVRDAYLLTVIIFYVINIGLLAGTVIG